MTSLQSDWNNHANWSTYAAIQKNIVLTYIEIFACKRTMTSILMWNVEDCPLYPAILGPYFSSHRCKLPGTDLLGQASLSLGVQPLGHPELSKGLVVFQGSKLQIDQWAHPSFFFVPLALGNIYTRDISSTKRPARKWRVQPLCPIM